MKTKTSSLSRANWREMATARDVHSVVMLPQNLINLLDDVDNLLSDLGHAKKTIENLEFLMGTLPEITEDLQEKCACARALIRDGDIEGAYDILGES